ncbi:MAG: hypothetical protein QY332_20755 [Anaerolineales bacterium]|nr:MAG: hypothetical protein QY332_20755 [Anaerolineales bacterium]
MNKSTQFAMMMETLTELVQEEQAPQPAPVVGLPNLKSVLADASPLPREALFLGLAEDGLPVLLNLYDPIPGPILISGDKSSGKTTLLQAIAHAAGLTHSPSEVQYGVITPHPDEWRRFHGNQNNAGIYCTPDDNAQELLQSLVTWAHNNKGGEQSILLLIDGLEDIVKLGEQTLQNLRWLLLRGPSRRVWSFITLNASRARDLKDWLDFFRTRLFGHIENSNDAYLLTGTREQTLDHLLAGKQFALRENDKLLGFYAPSIE